MRTLAIFGPEPICASHRTGHFMLEGRRLACALKQVDAPVFDAAAPENAGKVLVRKRGFSFNYRDRALMLSLAVNGPPGSFYGFGSDFVAEVLSVGPAVTGLAAGDRVIGNAAYPESGAAGVAAGVPANSASRELQVFPAVKLMKIPDSMNDEVAAGFTIGAQTSYSMVRKIGIAPGDPVLVTAARSNTSLFAIAALARRGAIVHASTTSRRDDAALRAAGVAGIIHLDRAAAPDFAAHPVCQGVLRSHGGYAAVVDPFFDLYLVPALAVMAFGARYTTCGMHDQHSHLVGAGAAPAIQASGANPLVTVMMKNLSVIGNCIGLSEDLALAVADHAAGRFPVIVDSVFRDSDGAAAFLERSYNAPDRFGKTVFLYD